MSVVLASQSAARATLLRNAGVSFLTVSAGVDEEALKAGLLADSATPRDIADALAETKAVKASRRYEGLVIGADQTLDLDGALGGKPPSLEAARSSLRALRGRAHRLHSAVVVARAGQSLWREVASATLHVRAFSDAFLDSYVAAEGEELLHLAGGYRLEGLGLQLFDRIDGDYFAILGLPMTGLLDFLRQHGELQA